MIMLRDVLFLANEDFNQIRKSKEKQKTNWGLDFGPVGIAGCWLSNGDDMRKTKGVLPCWCFPIMLKIEMCFS
jgi:hypothetical protein